MIEASTDLGVGIGFLTGLDLDLSSVLFSAFHGALISSDLTFVEPGPGPGVSLEPFNPSRLFSGDSPELS